MTGLNHGITGAAIALIVKEPVLAIPLAFFSHFLCDIIPHWDYGASRDKGKLFTGRFDRILAADFVLSLVLMAFLGILFSGGSASLWLIWVCMIAAASPDLMWAYYRLYQEHIKKQKVRLDPLAKLHHKIQWSQTPNGLYFEIAWFVLVFSFILMRYYIITTSPR